MHDARHAGARAPREHERVPSTFARMTSARSRRHKL
jgi:hypothetical protein